MSEADIKQAVIEALGTAKEAERVSVGDNWWVEVIAAFVGSIEAFGIRAGGRDRRWLLGLLNGKEQDLFEEHIYGDSYAKEES